MTQSSSIQIHGMNNRITASVLTANNKFFISGEIFSSEEEQGMQIVSDDSKNMKESVLLFDDREELEMEDEIEGLLEVRRKHGEVFMEEIEEAYAVDTELELEQTIDDEDAMEKQGPLVIDTEQEKSEGEIYETESQAEDEHDAGMNIGSLFTESKKALQENIDQGKLDAQYQMAETPTSPHNLDTEILRKLHGRLVTVPNITPTEPFASSALYIISDGSAEPVTIHHSYSILENSKGLPLFCNDIAGAYDRKG